MGNVVSIQQARMKRNQAGGDEVLDGGYIKLSRRIQDCAFKRDPDRFALWVHMLLEATHKPYKTLLGNQTVQLQVGQFVSGVRDLARDTGSTERKVRTSIEYFEREGMILRDTSNRLGTVFTIVKYADYQGKNTGFGDTPTTHLNDTPSDTLEARYGEASGDNATHQPTHQRHTKTTRIQEDNKYTSPYGEECESDDSTHSTPQEKSSRYPSCPHRELLALWAEVIPETVQHNPSEWRSGRAGYKALAARWKAGFTTMKRDGVTPLYTDRESGMAWWRSFFEYLRKSDFLMTKCRPFCLEWVVKQENYLKTKEGKFHDKP